jgi:CRISPR/Cas system-associated exonuclease Cas4 (RecB family)
MSAPSRYDAKWFARQPTDELIAARDRLVSVLDSRARQTELFPAVPDVPTPAPRPAPQATAADLPAVLSPSSVNCYQQCSAKWYYRKVLRLREQITGAAVLGRAVHAAIGASMREKMESLRDQPVAQVQANFRDALELELAGAVMLTADETPTELRETGEALLHVYMRQAAPSIQPAAVELPVSGFVGDVPAHGFVDILDVSGAVIDTKSAGKRPGKVSG